MTQLFLEVNSALPDGVEPEDLIGLAGLVVDGSRVTPGQCEPLPVTVAALTGGSPEELTEWCEQAGAPWVVDGGLDECARLRDAWPELSWMPRLVAYKPDVVYRMSDYPGEGFKFYAPDTAAIRGYRVHNEDLALEHALARARELGFGLLWLHARHAADRGNGLDLDLLGRAQRHFGQGLWFSGGATEPHHLANLAREGGASAAVIDSALLARATVEVLAAALAPLPSPEAPIHFEPRKRDGAGTG